jgi:hypothetical protein
MKKVKEKTLTIVSAIVLILPVLLNCLPVYAADAGVTATVLNAAPTVSVELTPDNDPARPGVQVINPDNTTNKTVTIIANVTDLNGYDDIVNTSVIANITGPSVVEDSPVSLSFDSVVNVTTATYTGSFNMSTHSEGDYKVEVTAADAGGLTGISSKNFTYVYAICELPDLVITDIWNVGNKIYYNITNIGNVPAPRSLSVLRVDGQLRSIDLVRGLDPGENSTESFGYRWKCSLPEDTIRVCVDFWNRIDECNETNNCETEIWSCTNSFQHAICELPDLVITDVWNVGNRIYYNITNIGNETAPRGFTNLSVDGVQVRTDRVSSLALGESSTESFWWYRWRCSPPEDTIRVCADFQNRIAECNETNNCRREVWSCG